MIRLIALLETLRVERRDAGRPRDGSTREEERDPECMDRGAGARSSPHHPGLTECMESELVLRVR
jgi:hypothetical protein